MDGRELEDLRDLAVEAATAAGQLLLAGAGGELLVDTKSSPTDVVTQMDRAAEHLLVERLLGARPDDGILGEEGASVAGTSGVRWVVDPLDGTVNYLFGIPAWGVSVAAEADGRSVVGVVVAPALGETYEGVLGGGSRLTTAAGTRELRVSEVSDLAAALVATGFGYLPERRRSQAAVVADLLPRIRDIRRVGACSVDLCWLAAGRVDAYFERGPHLWDHAAGGLIAREAGAALVLAAVPGVFGALHDELVRLGADTDG